MTLLQEALTYLEAGLSVIPIRPNEKVPAIAWAEYQKRLPSLEEVTGWFSGPEGERKNIAVVCGAVSNNRVVLDFDRLDAYELWAAEEPQQAKTAIVETPNGGRHVHFAIKNTVPRCRKLPKGTGDIKGEGGYVLMPPSVIDGKPYRLLHGDLYQPLEEEFASEPEDRPLVETRTDGKAHCDGQYFLKEAFARSAVGNRNDTGFGLACQLRDMRLSQVDAEPLMREYAERVPQDGQVYTATEALASLKSAYSKLPREPASLPNSIPAPIEYERARKEFGLPLPASQLGTGEPVAWAWQGYLAFGYVTLLSGIWKGGKTTLLAHLLRMMDTGGDLAGVVDPGSVLMISEEGQGLWSERCCRVGIGDHVEFYTRPFKGRPTSTTWERFVAWVAALAQERGYKLVVFDTLAGLFPVDDENDAAKMLTALTPLHRIAEAGAAVLLVHHPRKGDGTEAQGTRGSGALPGFVDIIVELRRYDATQRQDRRRVLTTYSRFDESSPEAVIELAEDGSGYRLAGQKADAKQADRWKVIEGILSQNAPGMSAEQVLESWPDGAGIVKPGRRTVETDLKEGTTIGRWAVEGKGVKGDPLRYRRSDSIPASTPSIGAGKEFANPASGDEEEPGREQKLDPRELARQAAESSDRGDHPTASGESTP